MLKYNGKLYFDKPLNDEELKFLNEWQEKLVDIYKKYKDTKSQSEKELISSEINQHSGINFNDKQRWAIFFAMSPMIYFHKDYIELKGQSKKGNMREALMAYHHFFLGEDAVLKECINLHFMQVHNLNGIVEAYKKDKDSQESRWCYLVKNNQVSSINDTTLTEYNENPNKWKCIDKEDTFYDKLVRYFPPLIEYASIKRTINKQESQKVQEKTQKRIKI